MREPDVAIVFTPEPWVEELHRHFTDHGGARVRQLIVDPAIARREQFATLIVGWRWASLTRGFVHELHEQGRTVLGVCDAQDDTSREILSACGVDRVVTSDAPYHEFIEALIILQSDPVADAVLQTRPATQKMMREREAIIAVTGPGGTGTTEIAIELARSIHGMVVDCNEIAPSVASRLAVGIEPNIRTVIDAVEHGLGEPDDGVVAEPKRGVEVVVGIPNVSGWSHVRGVEASRALHALAQRGPVVADLGSMCEEIGPATRGRFAVTRSILHDADAIVAVGTGNPVGLVKLLGWIGDVRCIQPGAILTVVLNRAPSDRGRCAELADEIGRVLGDVAVFCVPTDRRVEAAVWAGELVRHGPFSKAISGVILAIDDVIASDRSRRRSDISSPIETDGDAGRPTDLVVST